MDLVLQICRGAFAFALDLDHGVQCGERDQQVRERAWGDSDVDPHGDSFRLGRPLGVSVEPRYFAAADGGT